ncbi:hypothetical protein FZ983_18530 [Azospirillum sp. B21]|nr:hypothetical protein FZ983_18530 [Azospirillum sp. B21]
MPDHDEGPALSEERGLLEIRGEIRGASINPGRSAGVPAGLGRLDELRNPADLARVGIDGPLAVRDRPHPLGRGLPAVGMMPSPVGPLEFKRVPRHGTLSRPSGRLLHPSAFTVQALQGAGEDLHLQRRSAVVRRFAVAARLGLSAHLPALLVGDGPGFVPEFPDATHDGGALVVGEGADPGMMSLFDHFEFRGRQPTPF